MILLAALLAAAPSVTDACPVPAPWRVAKSDPRAGGDSVLLDNVVIFGIQPTFHATYNGSPVDDDGLASRVKEAYVAPLGTRLIVNSTLTDCPTLLHVLKIIADTGRCAVLDCVVAHRDFPRPPLPNTPLSLPPPLPAPRN